MKITEEQKKVIEAKEGAFLVIALAGSGKTFCITKRIAELIKDGVNSSSILALTFTTKAAKEMSDRVEKYVGEHNATICTFHSLAHKAFTQYSEDLGYKNFEIVTPGVVKSKIISIFKDEMHSSLNKDMMEEINKFITKIGKMKTNYGKPNEYFEPSWVDIYKKLERYMKIDKQITFDDLIYKICGLFEKIPHMRASFNKKYKYIIVDESQDTNKVQFKLMELMDTDKNTMIVGDPNQSIYRFQGAKVENIFDFDKKYNPEILYLSKNFRSTQSIIDVSNRILEYSLYDEKYRKKAVASSEETGKKPKFLLCKDEKEQAIAVADYIQKYKDKNKYNDNNFTILYRNNSQSIYFEKELMFRKIPFVVKGGSFANRKEIQFIISCLKISDIEHYKRELLYIYTNITHNFDNNISDKIIQSVYTFKKDEDFKETVRSAVPIPNIGKIRRKSLNELVDFIDDIELSVPKKSEYHNYDCLDITISKILDVYRKTCEDSSEFAFREEGLYIFKDLWIDYFKTSEDKSLKGFINNFTLKFALDGEAAEENTKEKESVILSTVHSYKGREREVVFVTNLKDGFFTRNPNNCSKEEYMDVINLFYVACSRAKKRMILSATMSGFNWFYKENTYSLLQMFMGTELVKYIKDNYNMISRKTDFYKSFEDYHLENQFYMDSES